MPSGLAWLSGLSAGASTLGKGMDEKALLAEQRKRQAMQDALAELSKFDELGITEDTPRARETSLLNQPVDAMGTILGGPSLTEQRSSQREALEQGVKTLPDGRKIIIDHTQSRSAREADAALRRLMQTQESQDRRQEFGKQADYDRQIATIRETAANRPGSFGDVTLKDGVYALNNQTGQRGARLGDSPPRATGGNSDIINNSRQLQDEIRLRNNYEASPPVKDAAAAADGISRAKIALQRNEPLNDLLALYSVIKIYDPNAVRGEEIKLAGSAISMPERLRLLWENTARGTKMLPHQKSQIRQMVDDTQQEFAGRVRPVQKRFGASAREFGVDSARVARDPFEGSGEDRKAKYRSP